MATSNSVTPMIQLISRGRRKAPVKNIRPMWNVMAAMNMTAAQWWAWRITNPARTLNEMLMTEA